VKKVEEVEKAEIKPEVPKTEIKSPVTKAPEVIKPKVEVKVEEK
jgi:hypothetical protein